MSRLARPISETTNLKRNNPALKACYYIFYFISNFSPKKLLHWDAVEIIFVFDAGMHTKICRVGLLTLSLLIHWNTF